MIEIKDAFKPLFPETTVKEFFTIEGKVYKRIQNRYTLRYERGGQAFFIKCHRGIGWREVFKNLLTLRLPVFDAGNEWRAIGRLHEIGLDTMQAVGWGVAGINPANRISFLITQSLEHTLDLESWFAQNSGRSDAKFVSAKRTLIKRLADITRRMHENGVNHRDYYLCHLRMDTDAADPLQQSGSIPIYIMDLHRAQIRDKTPQRWIVKDVAGLWYSSCYGPAGLKLTHTDLMRFVKVYKGKHWRSSLLDDASFWQSVKYRFEQDYVKEHP